jgi:hypothetical protein
LKSRIGKLRNCIAICIHLGSKFRNLPILKFPNADHSSQRRHIYN